MKMMMTWQTNTCLCMESRQSWRWTKPINEHNKTFFG